MLPNLELGMTFFLAYEKLRKEIKTIEEHEGLQQQQVPEDLLLKAKTNLESDDFVRVVNYLLRI